MGCILGLNASLFALILYHLSNLPAQTASSGVEQFTTSVVIGQKLGAAVFPGLFILCVVWLHVRIKAGRIVHRVDSAGDMGASRIVSAGNKVATVIFWIVGGGFLLLAFGALLFGR